MDSDVSLDVHAVSELANQGLSPTYDLPKFNYTANDKGEYGRCVCTRLHVCARMCMHVYLFDYMLNTLLVV